MDFITPEGGVNLNGSISVSVRFLSDKTNLKITTGSQVEADYFSDYFNTFGFRLDVYEVV